MTDTTNHVTPEQGTESRRVRVGTLTWGLIVAAIGVLAIAVSLGFWVDLGLMAIALCCVAGAALILGSVFTNKNRRD